MFLHAEKDYAFTRASDRLAKLSVLNSGHPKPKSAELQFADLLFRRGERFRKIHFAGGDCSALRLVVGNRLVTIEAEGK